jgi:hypothetical protein
MYLHFYSIVPFESLSLIYYKFGGLSLGLIKNKQDAIFYFSIDFKERID